MRSPHRSPPAALRPVSSRTKVKASAMRPLYSRPLAGLFTTPGDFEVRFRDRRLLSLLLIALASVSALALSACGGGDDSGDAKALLSEGFKKPIPKATVSVDLEIKATGSSALSQPVSFKLNGP